MDVTALQWRWIFAALLVSVVLNTIQHYAGYPALDYWHGFLRSVSAVMVWETGKRAWLEDRR